MTEDAAAARPPLRCKRAQLRALKWLTLEDAARYNCRWRISWSFRDLLHLSHTTSRSSTAAALEYPANNSCALKINTKVTFPQRSQAQYAARDSCSWRPRRICKQGHVTLRVRALPRRARQRQDSVYIFLSPYIVLPVNKHGHQQGGKVSSLPTHGADSVPRQLATPDSFSGHDRRRVSPACEAVAQQRGSPLGPAAVVRWRFRYRTESGVRSPAAATVLVLPTETKNKNVRGFGAREKKWFKRSPPPSCATQSIQVYCAPVTFYFRNLPQTASAVQSRRNKLASQGN